MMTNLLKIFLLLLFAINTQAQWILQGSGRSASNKVFYVSNTGDDSNDGKTPSTAWKTIGKVNSYEFAAGSKVLFRRGDKWEGEALVTDSNVTYSAYGSGYKPTFDYSITLSNWTQYSTVGGVAYDTVYQDGSATGTNTIGYMTGYKVEITGSGTLVKYLVYTAGSSLASKCALYDSGLNLVANTTSEELTSQPVGWATYNVSGGATINSGTYWIGFRGDGVYSIPWGTTSSSNDYFYTNATYSAFPPSSISSPNYSMKSNAPIGVVLQTSGSGYDTVWVAYSSKSINGGRILNGEYYWDEQVNLADVDAYNEVYINSSKDSLYVFNDTNVVVYSDTAVKNYVSGVKLEHLYIKGSAIAIDNSAISLDVDSVYILYAKTGIKNTGTINDVKYSDFIYTKFGVFNVGTIDSMYYNELERANLSGGNSIYNTGTLKLFNNSFYSNKASASIIYSIGNLTFYNNAVQGTDTLILSHSGTLVSDYNAYDNFKGKRGSNYYTSLADWQTGTGDDINSVIGVGYNNPSGFDLTLSSNSNAINRGYDFGFRKDKKGNTVPRKDTVDIGANESDYYSPGAGSSTDYGPASEYVYVRANGSNIWADRTDSSVGINLVTLNQNIGNLIDESQVLFKAGDVFNDTLIIENLNPATQIIFGRYSNGSNPKLSIWTELPDWKNSSSWRKENDTAWVYHLPSRNAVATVNRLWIDGTEYPFAHDGTADHPEIGDSMAFGSWYRWKPLSTGDSLRIYVPPSGNIPYDYYNSIKWACGRGNSGAKNIIYVKNSSNLRFYDIDFEGSPKYAMRLQFVENITIKNCDFKYFHWGAIRVVGGNSKNIKVLNNRIDTELSKIYNPPLRYELENQNQVDIAFGPDSCEVAYNKFFNSGISAVRVSSNNKSDYVSSYSSNQPIGNIIHDNYFYCDYKYKGRMKAISVNVFLPDGYDSTFYPKDTRIYRNYIEQVSATEQIGGFDTWFYFNIIKKVQVNNGYYILDHYGNGSKENFEIADDKTVAYRTTSDNYPNKNERNVIFNNTFVNIGKEAFLSGGNDSKVFNNLFVNTNTQKVYGGNPIACYMKHWALKDIRNNISWDDYEHNSNSKTVYYENPGGSNTYETWSSFETKLQNDESGSIASGNKVDTGSNSINDIFVSVNNDDFSLKSGFTGKNYGIDISSYVPSGFTDYYGNIVVQSSPNVGAVDNKD